MKTKIFCDSANIKTVKEFNSNSIVSGFTTNPNGNVIAASAAVVVEDHTDRKKFWNTKAWGRPLPHQRANPCTL